jgi:hypothetical protein
MLVSITYDLNEGWGEVKEAAFDGPFFNIIETSNGQKQAPNTTLFVQRLTSADALTAFDRAVAVASTKLKRQIIVQRCLRRVPRTGLFAATSREREG